MYYRRIKNIMDYAVECLHIYSCCTIFYGHDLHCLLRGAVLKRHGDVVPRAVWCRHVSHRHVQLVRVQGHGNVLSRGSKSPRHNLAAKPSILPFGTRTALREGLHVVPVFVE